MSNYNQALEEWVANRVKTWYNNHIVYSCMKSISSLQICCEKHMLSDLTRCKVVNNRFRFEAKSRKKHRLAEQLPQSFEIVTSE